MDLIEVLKNFGFTGQEALLYITLLKHGEITGYEAAKINGISRSNAYSALSKLVEKGAIIKSNDNIKKYMAISKQDLVQTLKRSSQESLDFLYQNLPEKKSSLTPYFTVTGKKNILNKLHNIIDLAQKRIYISIHSQELKSIRDNIQTCIQRGIKTAIISDVDPEIPGVIYYSKVNDPGFIKIIADTARIFTCDLSQDVKNGLYSEEQHLVKIMRESILNEIELHKINRNE
ncbi:MAG: TrmB family transcriptional regulator [Deltaproteobacteria bacterium]|jgi:HTH-type transcriptional regulator, sugar sensing transcriptional regulator|nr:TrmB family transcriptional regulator [Deltaproteobacteria bacterium]